jgi:hypothetical protein
MTSRKLKPRNVLLFLAALLIPIGWARGGHEVPVYPSYYPHELRIETVPPERAAELLRDAKLHAYLGPGLGPGLGPEPPFPTGAPQSVRAVESLGDFVTVRINPTLARDNGSACEVADAIVRDMAGPVGVGGDGFVFHPYPVTPFDGDYLIHADRAEAEKTRLMDSVVAAPARPPKVKADGALAGLVRSEWRAEGPGWDAAVEAVDAAGLVAGARYALNGWLGPAWVKTGWFHALRLLADAGVAEARQLAEAMAQRLERGDYRDTLERVNLERELVAALGAGCGKRVAGYTIRRHYFSGEFTNGIENIGFDSIEGLNSPLFIRTVKLKNFPWNGELMLGIDARPEAAWNPIAGFSDGFGRLMWSAIGDPALVSSPYDSGWMVNRIADVRSTPGG